MVSRFSVTFQEVLSNVVAGLADESWGRTDVAKIQLFDFTSCSKETCIGIGPDRARGLSRPADPKNRVSFSGLLVHHVWSCDPEKGVDLRPCPLPVTT